MIAVVSPSSTSTSGRASVGMKPCTNALYVSLICRCESAAIVSNTSELLPDPETPVNTVSRRFGSAMLTSLRLFSRAPCTRIRSWVSATCAAAGCVCVLVAVLMVLLVLLRQRDRAPPGVYLIDPRARSGVTAFRIRRAREQGPDRLDGVRLGRCLVRPVPDDAGEAQRDAAGVAGAALRGVQRDLDHQLRPQPHAPGRFLDRVLGERARLP